MSETIDDIELLDHLDEAMLEENGWRCLDAFLHYKKAVEHAHQSKLRVANVGLRKLNLNNTSIWELWTS